MALTPILVNLVNCEVGEFAAIGAMFIIVGMVNVTRIKTDSVITSTVSLISTTIGLIWVVTGVVDNVATGTSFCQGPLPAICLVITLNQSIDSRRKRFAPA